MLWAVLQKFAKPARAVRRCAEKISNRIVDGKLAKQEISFRRPLLAGEYRPHRNKYHPRRHSTIVRP